MTTAPSGDSRIEALRSGYKWGVNSLTYSFYYGGSYYGSESSPAPVSDAVKANVRYIFQNVFTPLINMTFTEVPDTAASYGVMRFLVSTSASYAYAYLPTGGNTNVGTSADVVGDVVLNPTNDVSGGDFNARNNSFQSGPGSHGFSALIHEMGHALGLKHPFDAGGSGVTLPTAENNQDNTVMTYTFEGSEPATLMPYDALALQYFYGANIATRSSNTTYSFTAVDSFSPGSGNDGAPTTPFGRMRQTLWDSGGTDTVDLSAVPTVAGGYRIDIQPGGWITANSAYNTIIYSGSNVATDYGTRIPLSGTTVENVVVTRSADTIYLNAAANTVSGYGPTTSSGGDVIYGSNQLDTLDLTQFMRTSVVETQAGSDLVLNLGAAGTVTVKDYYAAAPGGRMQIRYKPDTSIVITADRSQLKSGDAATLSFVLGMSSNNFTASDVSVTGGSLTNFSGSGTAYTATFTPTPNFTGTGVITVAAGVFTDIEGTPNAAGSLQLSIDTVAPTLTITRAGSGILKPGNTARITFTLSEPSSNFVAADVSVSGGMISNFTGSGATYSATFTPTANQLGTATIAVNAAMFTDAVGNPNGAAEPLSIPFDTVTTALSISRARNGALKVGDSDTITFTLSEPSTDFTVADVAVTGGSISNFTGSGTSFTARFAPAGSFQGTATVSVAAGMFANTRGNPNAAASLGIPVDTLGPTLRISRSGSGTPKIGSTAVVTFTLSEPSTDFVAGDVAVTGGSLSNFTGLGTTYSATFTPAASFPGTATVSVAAGTFTDLVGNPNATAASLAIPVDTVAPTLTITRDGSGALRAGSTDKITFTLSEASSNFVAADVSVTGGTLTNFTGSGTTYTATFTPTAKQLGSASIAVNTAKFTDAVGNQNLTGASLTIAFDTIAPMLSISRAGNGVLKGGDSDTITFTLSEPSTDFTVADVAVTGGSISNFTGSGTTYTATFTPAGSFQGTARVSVAAGTFTDLAGNPNAAASLGIPVDTLPPTVRISRSGSGTLKIGSTAVVTFTLSEPSTDFVAGDVAVTGGSLSKFTGSGTTYSATFTPAALFQGTATVSVAAGTFTDPVGNPNATAASLAIPVDTVAPTLTITRDGSGALRAGSTDKITFTLSEASSNFVAGDVSVTGGKLTNFTGSGTTYTATFTPTANQLGSASIAVNAAKFTDAVGNQNLTGASLTIAFDTIAPTMVMSGAGTGTLKNRTVNGTFKRV